MKRLPENFHYDTYLRMYLHRTTGNHVSFWLRHNMSTRLIELCVFDSLLVEW